MQVMLTDVYKMMSQMHDMPLFFLFHHCTELVAETIDRIIYWRGKHESKENKTRNGQKIWIGKEKEGDM